MKKNFVFIICCFLCSLQTFASIDEIQAEYSIKMKNIDSSSGMRYFTNQATQKLENEQKCSLKILTNSLSEDEQNLVHTNQQLWDEYFTSSKESTFAILYRQMGWIYQELAIGNLHSQALTRALATYYSQKNSKIKPYDYLPQELEKCLQQSNSEGDACKCFDIQKNIYKDKIHTLLKTNKNKVTAEDYTRIVQTQQTWENLVINTQNTLFRIIDSQNTENSNLKKAQILFMLYQDRSGELQDIDRIPIPEEFE